jgi:hypothetical protein
MAPNPVFVPPMSWSKDAEGARVSFTDARALSGQIELNPAVTRQLS